MLRNAIQIGGHGKLFCLLIMFGKKIDVVGGRVRNDDPVQGYLFFQKPTGCCRFSNKFLVLRRCCIATGITLIALIKEIIGFLRYAIIVFWFQTVRWPRRVYLTRTLNHVFNLLLTSCNLEWTLRDALEVAGRRRGRQWLKPSSIKLDPRYPTGFSDELW